MLHEFTNDNKQFEILFTNFFGGYWRDDLKKIISNKISKELNENLISIGWFHTDSEIEVSVNDIKFQLKISEYDDISLILNSKITEESKQKLREWATIIAEEIERLKNV